MIKGTLKVFYRLISGKIYLLELITVGGNYPQEFRYMGVKQDYHIFVRLSDETIAEFPVENLYEDSIGFSEGGDQYKLLAETFELKWGIVAEGNNIRLGFKLPNGNFVEDTNTIYDWVFSLMKLDKNCCDSLEV